jgi:hypothetical protein
MTWILLAFGVGLIAGIVGTTYAAKAGWITPSNVKPL